MKKLTKKQVGMVVAAALLLGAGGTYAYAQQSTKKVEETREQLLLSTTKLENTHTEIEALLDKKDPNYLVKDVKEETIVALKAKVKEEILFLPEVELEEAAYHAFNKESKKVQDLMHKVDKAFKKQVEINKLYQKTAMNGPEVKKDLAIVDDLKSETVESVKKECFKEGATTEYDKTINALVSNAEDQLNQIDTAKAAVAKVYKDNKVLSTDKKLYDTAKAATDKVKNAKAKKALNDQLAKVKVELDKKAKEAEAKAPTESAAQDQAQTQANATNENQAVAAGNGQTDNGYQTPADQTPAYDGGGYVAPATNNDAGYQPPANATPADNNANQAPAAPAPEPANGGNGQGVMTQDEGNKAAEDASRMDPTKDPNSPWYK